MTGALHPFCSSLTTYDSEESTELLEIFYDWSEQPFDVTLVVKDGEQFKAHGSVLRGASSFFEKILDGNWKENQEGVIRLEALSDEIMEAILRFMYTGILDVNNMESALNLIAAADYLLFPKLKDIPEQFLKHNLSTSNCVSIYQFAEKYRSEELLAITRKFIHLNFTSVTNTEDFYALSFDGVEQWISSDHISISAEDDVFKIILKWIDHAKEERQEKFQSLFRHVRLGFVSLDCLLNEVVTNDLVKKDKFSYNSILEWMNGSTVCFDNFRQSPRKSLQRDALVVLGEDGIAWCYVTSQNEWFQLPDMPSVGRPECLLSFQNSLIVVDFSATWLEELPHYDPFLNEWTTLFLPTPQVLMQEIEADIATVLVVGEDICAIVNMLSTNDQGLYIYQYNLFKYVQDSVSWVMIPSFHLNPNHEDKSEVCFVPTDKCIYAIGGTEGPYDDEEDEEECSLRDAARFYIAEAKWEKIASIQRARSSAFGIAVGEKVFIAGGYFLDNGMFASYPEKILSRTCEMYDILTDQWQFIANLTIPRARASMVCVGGTLYVLGGLVKWQNSTVVECYNRDTNEWTQVTAVPAVVSANKYWEPSITSACSLSMLSIFLNGDLHSVLPNMDVLILSEVEFDETPPE